jgi:hypothetical protein
LPFSKSKQNIKTNYQSSIPKSSTKNWQLTRSVIPECCSPGLEQGTHFENLKPLSTAYAQQALRMCKTCEMQKYFDHNPIARRDIEQVEKKIKETRLIQLASS